MSIDRLPSGSYRIRATYKGISVSIVTDKKPSKAEAQMLIAKKLEEKNMVNAPQSFEKACEGYIVQKSNILSPSTIVGYRAIMRALPDDFMKLPVEQINSITVQKIINDIAAGHSPKYTRNIFGFISAVIGVYAPSLKLNVTLPQKIDNEPYVPSDDDIKRILERAKGTEYEVFFRLAIMGLRRSEILAITPDDIKGNILTICKAKVINTDNKYVLKTTKTTKSARQIYLPDDLIELINKNGLFKGHPRNPTNILIKWEQELGIPRFPLHKMRHYFATVMSGIMPEADVLRMGGWSTPNVMKSVYRHSTIQRNLDEQKRAAEEIQKRISVTNS